MEERALISDPLTKVIALGIAIMAMAGVLGAKSIASERPNVILVMTDDQGYGDFGVMGNPLIRTPNLDAMSRRSAWMTNFYVSPVCAPTRACLMTGRYNYRTRAIDTYIGRAMMDPSEVTLAEVLRGAGYATAIFGKWHLGDNYPMRPIDQGFEEALVHRGGGIGQPSDPPGGEGKYTDPILFHNGRRVQAHGYCTDVYFDGAIQWMQESRKRNQNFFIYLATNAPHGPFGDVPDDLLAEYRKMDLTNGRFPQTQGHPLPAKNDTDKLARIFAMITNIDENMGRLFEKLDAMGLTDNTMVIFMVDNGPNTRRYVAGMRGKKSEIYEGGIRSPLFVQWPAALEAGRRSDRVAAHIDILPTVLDACGIERPKGAALDGRSLLPLLKGEPVVWPDRTIVIQSHRGNAPILYHNFAARSRRWKLLNASGFGHEEFSGEPHFELYDMVDDPLETRDLAAERPEIVEMMRKRYVAWFEDVGSTRPDNYAPPRIHIGTVHENPTVLTRQDWRHLPGRRPWAPDSIGYWELKADAGRYDVRLRFPSAKASGEAALKIADQSLTLALAEGATQCVFEDIELSEGEARLQALLTLGDSTKGPWQVDVIRR